MKNEIETPMTGTVQPIDTTVVKAPFVSVKLASVLTGVSSIIFRKHFPNKRKIGKDYYVKVSDVNAFIGA